MEEWMSEDSEVWLRRAAETLSAGGQPVAAERYRAIADELVRLRSENELLRALAVSPCRPERFSSKACQRGTISCVIDHETTARKDTPGCPYCSGDCSDANPPVYNCPNPHR